ncbi:alpha/beta hydrolase fold-domain-containing protein [Leucosporidium creatinivorum]|uniref:Alpha/beta hydrolase fold-domain-containing protein n=1 Tax=Leucosporidium creatinivorum TaxID=106004 RepID=A0A1Y2G1E8_9BASI|nr:alpha/beta hydrolase fold-domain-containing protein [Leucosporidium creatinivorum]
MSRPNEKVHKLDPELLAAYTATPWIVANESNVQAIRDAGGVSAPAPVPEGVEVLDVDQDGVQGKLYRKVNAPEVSPVLVWCHGGGYLFGTPAMHAGLYFQFVEAGMTVFAPRYRLSPEHPFPAPQQDALRAWDWIASGAGRHLGVAPSRLALGGTSAGGGLAASIALQLRDRGHALQPSALVLNIPWLARPPREEASKTSWSSVKFDRIWSLANAQFAAEAYFPSKTADLDKYAFAADHPSLHGLPPTIVSVSELDVLRDSAIEWATRVMRDSEKGAELHVYRGAYHGSSGAVPSAAGSTLTYIEPLYITNMVSSTSNGSHSNGHSNGSHSNGATPYTYLHEPGFQQTHKRIIIVGGGMSGIQMAYTLSRKHKNVEFVIYEECDSEGGTWTRNRYPGVQCDVYSAVYQFTWAPNPRWSKIYAEGGEILNYIRNTVSDFGLSKFFRLKHKVVGASFSEANGKWSVDVEGPGGRFTDTADIFISAMGCLNLWKWPQLPGRELYKGTLLHSAAWPEGGMEQLAGKRVACIGNGASAVQLVPSIVNAVGNLDFYFRTPGWMGGKPPPGTQVLNSDHTPTFHYTEEQKQKWAADPASFMAYRKAIEAEYDHGLWGALNRDNQYQHTRRAAMQARMEAKIADPELRKKLIPDFPAGCRRVTPEDGFLEALQVPQTEVLNTPLAAFTEKGLLLSTGEEREYDVIIAATGFETNFRPPFPIRGLGGVDLATKWTEDYAQSFGGVVVDGFPNYWCFMGPASPVGQGSILSAIEMQSHYFSQLLTIVQESRIKYLVPKAERVAQYNEHLQSLMPDLVWTSPCNSWFKDGPTGRIVAGYPPSPNFELTKPLLPLLPLTTSAGSMWHYSKTIAKPRLEDFDISYQHKNPYTYLANGWVDGEEDFTYTKPESGLNSLPWTQYLSTGAQ